MPWGIGVRGSRSDAVAARHPRMRGGRRSNRSHALRFGKLSSDCFREHGAASSQDDAIGLEPAERHHLVDNFMWANDYPHHEGS